MIEVTGTGALRLRDVLEGELRQLKASRIGVASAFVSSGATRWLVDLCRETRFEEMRLIAGLDNAITHPNALRLAQEAGWSVRSLQGTKGIFHAKMMVASHAWNEHRDSGLCMLGSANLTNAALDSNIESTFLSGDPENIDATLRAFAHLWDVAEELTSSALSNYAAHFAEVARRRPPSLLTALGVRQDEASADLPSVDVDYATVVWVGLESFTGEHQLQVEIPRSPAMVLNKMVEGRLAPDGSLGVHCEDDGKVRSMTLRFYADNQMYRLNIPNDTPMVEWVRENREGILVLSRGPEGGPPVRLQILRPGGHLEDITERSFALGTWGNTSTRFYGWQ